MRIVLSSTDLIAIYAAVVATIVAFHQLRDSLPRVRVYVQKVVLLGCYQDSIEMIQLRASMSDRRQFPLRVSHLSATSWFQYPRRRQIRFLVKWLPDTAVRFSSIRPSLLML